LVVCAVRLAGILALIFLAASCDGTRPQRAPAHVATRPVVTPDVFPGKHWEVIPDSESVGFSRPKLASALAYARLLKTTGLMIVVGGRVLVAQGNIHELSYLASVRKSVLAMLYGNAVESGKIRLDATLAELGIDDVGGLSATEKEATIADLLSARSGVFHLASNPGDNLADAPARNSKRHGEYFLYRNWDFNALGTIFEKETGTNVYDALEAEIARPISMEDFNRDAQKNPEMDAKETSGLRQSLVGLRRRAIARGRVSERGVHRHGGIGAIHHRGSKARPRRRAQDGAGRRSLGVDRAVPRASRSDNRCPQTLTV
jgi:CubicO group peptidase (beta-lactamase class C family)